MYGVCRGKHASGQQRWGNGRVMFCKRLGLKLGAAAAGRGHMKGSPAFKGCNGRRSKYVRAPLRLLILDTRTPDPSPDEMEAEVVEEMSWQEQSCATNSRSACRMGLTAQTTLIQFAGDSDLLDMRHSG